MEQLKKCPFCGGEAFIPKNSEGECCTWIVCNECSAESGYYESLEEAIAAWNTRKPMERILERLEETKGKDIVFFPPRSNNKTAMLGQRIGLDRAIEIVKEEM